jgi:EAL domain-containing protein (putative c-di-GMP-specific phosphodiesterase class I)
LSTNEEDAAKRAETVVNKILASLNQPCQLGEVTRPSSASIGVTLFNGDRLSIDDLMKQADLAMYRTKESGKNGWTFFDPLMESKVRDRAALEDDLRRALDQKQFMLYFQPQVLADGRVTGSEALVRWQHPQRNIVAPGDFIPLAEETGLILPLGNWVLEAACSQLAIWASDPAMAHLTVAVNVSARQFSQHDFVSQVLSIIKKTNADPNRLKLELTESLLVADLEDVIGKMSVLKSRGVGFSLDDFGTGYSSLKYLKRLPLDQLKIDQSFVRDVFTDANDAAIARTIVTLAQSLGLGVIAEGVETESQRDFLAKAGCYAYQGYLFSRPLSIQDFETFVRRA